MHYSSPLLLSLLLLLLSVPAIFLLVTPRVLPPKTLPSIPDPDEADDLALFRRATISSSTALPLPLPRPHSPQKIAFLFLTNSDLSFAPLWERFFRGHRHSFNLYIHLDPNSKLNSSLLTSSFVGRFIPAKATQRGSPTLISAARRLLAAALLDDPSNAFFALVSQHCVPSARSDMSTAPSSSPTGGGGNVTRAL
ncbi:Uncharacterized protein M6B38_221390 [Iris pallida]|uniref:Core-2/I-branching beta-1,6-N-acetylglucosaminyltransferase family protein n=1 Tax=Iris pallida TaxID=29817 RepID=A0AAX6DYY8_IRIPA|nr:Uncharacterized protein M6B38_221390 [Iris pallida]